MIQHKKQKNKTKSAHESTMGMPSNKRQNIPCEGWSSGHEGRPDGVRIYLIVGYSFLKILRVFFFLYL